VRAFASDQIPPSELCARVNRIITSQVAAGPSKSSRASCPGTWYPVGAGASGGFRREITTAITVATRATTTTMISRSIGARR
jgi:hypothetical protein